MSDLALLTEAFHRNGRVNEALLNTLTEEDLELSDGQGGLSVGQLLEHLFGMRKVYLHRVGSTYAEQITVETEEGDQPFWPVTLSPKQLQGALAEADAAVLNAVQDAAGGGPSFQHDFASHPAQLLVLTLIHDANHRGQITTLLRQGGRSAAALDQLARATWPIWRD
ncbi:DinB family protein [Deinococcus sp. HMF7604]|uniref:DinB family protein n=1 Tax=Deinococcus betulae TaxID=2873312 RepID=UPI001CCEFA7E|nr:DinB family protein [Deinococcus betulae]